MKIFVYTLTIALLFFSFEVFSEESEKIDTDLTEKQKLFTELIKSLEPIEVKWINTFTVDVTYEQGLLDVMSEPETKRHAELLAKLGYEITHENICVKVTNPSGKELAYMCAGKTGL